MKLLSHSPAEEPKSKKSVDDEKDLSAASHGTKRKKISKEEQEKKGRYWGFILLLFTLIAAILYRLLSN